LERKRKENMPSHARSLGKKKTPAMTCIDPVLKHRVPQTSYSLREQWFLERGIRTIVQVSLALEEGRGAEFSWLHNDFGQADIQQAASCFTTGQLLETHMLVCFGFLETGELGP
jgi:hypothetical protein